MSVAIGYPYRDTDNRLMLRAVTAPPGVGLGRPYRSGDVLMGRIAGTDGVLEARLYRDVDRLYWRAAGEGEVCTYVSELSCAGMLQAWGIGLRYQVTVTAAAAGGYQGVWDCVFQPLSTWSIPGTQCHRWFWLAQEGARKVWLTMEQALFEFQSLSWMSWGLYLGGNLVSGAITGYTQGYGGNGLGAFDGLSPVHRWWVQTGDLLNEYPPPGRAYVSGPDPDPCATMRCQPNALTAVVTGLVNQLGRPWSKMNGTHRLVPSGTTGAFGVKRLIYVGPSFDMGGFNASHTLLWDVWQVGQDPTWAWDLDLYGRYLRASPPAASCSNQGWPEGTYDVPSGAGTPAGARMVVTSMDLTPPA